MKGAQAVYRAHIFQRKVKCDCTKALTAIHAKYQQQVESLPLSLSLDSAALFSISTRIEKDES